MKSKRAMIERRNAERRLRRQIKKNPPGLFFKWFDTTLKWAHRLFLLSIIIIAISPIMFLIPGLKNKDLTLFIVERVFTFLLFGIMLIACLVGTWAIFKPTNDSTRNGDKTDLRRKKIIKATVLLFFAVVTIVAAIVCWAQLKILVGVWKSLLSNLLLAY